MEKHYEIGVETIDIIKGKLTPEQFKGFLLGNILKYATRVGKKDEDEKDEYKILDYAHYLVKGSGSLDNFFLCCSYFFNSFCIDVSCFSC